MGRTSYIPQPALDNLKKYSYKGVDKCVIVSPPSLAPPPDPHPPSLAQVARLAIHPPAILELAGHAVADLGRTQYRTHPRPVIAPS